jgi:hypothetical protein
MNYKYFMLKQIDNEIVVIANKEPKPDLGWKSVEAYGDLLGSWMANHETFRPYDNEQERLLIDHAWGGWNGRATEIDLQQGIEIACCEIREVAFSVPGLATPAYSLCAFYKPEEQKEESQEDLIDELIKHTFGASITGRERIKDQFTITRKSK